jgi:hypothetical protein
MKTWSRFRLSSTQIGCGYQLTIMVSNGFPLKLCAAVRLRICPRKHWLFRESLRRLTPTYVYVTPWFFRYLEEWGG